MPGPLPEPTSVDRPYWDAAREGRLVLQRCLGCDQLRFPPAARCPACGSPEVAWIETTGRGTVWSWVVFHRRYFAGMPPPYTVLRVKLAEGPALIANLVGDQAGLRIDAPVEVVFEVVDGVTLPQFRLARPAPAR